MGENYLPPDNYSNYQSHIKVESLSRHFDINERHFDIDERYVQAGIISSKRLFSMHFFSQKATRKCAPAKQDYKLRMMMT